MHVQELMTAPVLTIGPDASLKDVAAIFVEHGISGMPVCDAENRVIGVISEGDILYKEEGRAVGRRDAVLAWLSGGSHSGPSLKANAQSVREAMTSPPLTVSPWSSVSEAARLMTERGVNRLPVVQNDELVGIVTRTDMVRAFARTDEEIALELRDEVLGRIMWLEPDTVAVEVTRGKVKLAGTLQTRSDVNLLERLAARVPGVVAVVSELRWDFDDLSRLERMVAGRTPS